jgi:hypothetical protein
MMRKSLFCFLLSLWAVAAVAQGQENISISVLKEQIALNEALQIAIVGNNTRIENYGSFPDVTGFTRANISTSSATNIINGRVTSIESIIQNYRPRKEGTYTIPAFTLTVNGKTIRFAGATVEVGPSKRYTDPFEEFWNGIGMRDDEPVEFVNVKEDAFFAITSDKNEVFQGEGANVTMAFYIAEANKAVMEFYDLGEQITDILKKIKPAHCWEENFGIDRVVPEMVNIKGKNYRQYKLYQATFFPLNTTDIVIPKVEFRMLKYNISQGRSAFGRPHQRVETTFSSSAKTIKVKPLPPHPLSEKIPVGVYKLNEEISHRERNTGESFSYKFQISGEGNLASIATLEPPLTTYFDFYPPNVQQQITRSNGAVYGSKTFNFMAIPNEPGTHQMADYFQWVFFNPRTARYDTLSSALTLQASGESRMNNSIGNSDGGGFYELIFRQDNTFISLNRPDVQKFFSNIAILLLLLGTMLIVFWKSAPKQNRTDKRP